MYLKFALLWDITLIIKESRNEYYYKWQDFLCKTGIWQSFTITVSLLNHVILGIPYLLQVILISFWSHCNKALSLISLLCFPCLYNSNFEADQSKISPYWIGVEMNPFIHFTLFHRVPIMCQLGTYAKKNSRFPALIYSLESSGRTRLLTNKCTNRCIT